MAVVHIPNENREISNPTEVNEFLKPVWNSI